MAELEIRPTMRFIRLGYATVAALLGAALVWWANRQDAASLAAVAAAAVLLAWPMARHVQRQRIRCRVAGGQLRYEEGLLSTTTKTIPVAGIQDVTVRRSLGQRIWGVGNLRIETAGHASALEISNVEDPQGWADKILEASGRTGSTGTSNPRTS